MQSPKSSYVGNEAQLRKGILHLAYPIEHGIVRNWHDMEMLWQHVFVDELAVRAEDHALLMTEAPLNPKANREQMSQLVFETFQFPLFYIELQPILAFYASNSKTGIALESGDGTTSVVAIYDGYVLPHSMARQDLAGHDLTDYLTKLLMERGYAFVSTAERELVRDIKEKLCHVSLDFEKELETAAADTADTTKEYELPDGQKIYIGNEQFRVCEALFRPAMLGRTSQGVHELIFSSLMKCDLDMRRELCANVVLSGGTSSHPGFDERVESELTAMVTPGIQVKTKGGAGADRVNLVWQGGSILATSSLFPTMCVTRQEYDEHGSSIMHRKCF